MIHNCELSASLNPDWGGEGVDENSSSSSFSLRDSAECNNLMTLGDIIGCFGDASLPLSSASGTQKPWLFRVVRIGLKKISKAGRTLLTLEFCLSDKFGFGSVSAMGTCFPS